MNSPHHLNALLAAPDQRGEPVANVNGMMMAPAPRPPLRPDISYEALVRLLEAMQRQPRGN
jgi:hypothetical protein